VARSPSPLEGHEVTQPDFAMQTPRIASIEVGPGRRPVPPVSLWAAPKVSRMNSGDLISEYKRSIGIRTKLIVFVRVMACLLLAYYVILCTIAYAIPNVDIDFFPPAVLFGYVPMTVVAIFIFISFCYSSPRTMIVLLRPFGDRELGNHLKKFILRHVSGAGYIYTLSDVALKPLPRSNLLVMGLQSGLFAPIVFAVAPIFRPVLPLNKVVDEPSYMTFTGVKPTRFQSILNIFSGGQPFAIQSTDEWWHFCINILITKCNVILIDLTLVKDGTEYELIQIARLDLIHKCLFLVDVHCHARAKATIEKYFDRTDSIKLYLIDENGVIAHPSEFKKSLLSLGCVGQL
jgi:hypothetical protein